jgi:hypothetical protein
MSLVRHAVLRRGMVYGPLHLLTATGNGFPDYLCIDPDGRTTAWENTNLEFESIGQIKFSEGADRANVRFVDINGDVGFDNGDLDRFV